MIDRRTFLDRSAKTIVAMGAASLAAERSASAVPASERVRLAAIGIGGRQGGLIRGFLERDDCEITTLCDVYPNRDLVGRASKAVADKEGKAPKVVQDYRRVYDDPSIDAVVIATPDHWHAPLTIFACQAGKDVYVEKPPTHNIWEGRKMVEAAERYERIVQIGTQNRSAPYVIEAIDFIRSGGIGDIKICKVYNVKPGGRFSAGSTGEPRDGMDYDTWLGPAPHRPYNDRTVYGGGWHKYWDFSGGDLANDGIHQIDIARWLIDKNEHPKTVYSRGGNYVFQDDREVPDTHMVTFDYGDLLMTFELTQWTDYMLKTNGQIRGSSVFPYWPQNATRIELYGTKNFMILGRHGGGWQVFTADGKVVEQKYGRFPDPPHKESFIQSIKSRKPASAPAEAGHLSTSLVHLANISLLVGGELRFDSTTEKFVDNDRANRLVKREYREKFSVPDVV